MGMTKHADHVGLCCAAAIALAGYASELPLDGNRRAGETRTATSAAGPPAGRTLGRQRSHR